MTCRLTALGVVLFSSIIGCGPRDAREPGDGALPPNCEYPPAQGPTEPCCPSHGIDACGGGLFCAALDGRTIATCYFEHSRADGQSCTADEHCASMSCNTTAGACRTQLPTCEPAIGCAPLGGRRACVSGECMPVGDGSPGQICSDDSDCDAPLLCDPALSRCVQESNLGAPCTTTLGNPPSSECTAPYGTAFCRAYSCDAPDDCRGYCTWRCDYDPIEPYHCPVAGEVCVTGGGYYCVPTCTTAADCPLPELGCRYADYARTDVCRWCMSSDQCRPGLTCDLRYDGGVCL